MSSECLANASMVWSFPVVFLKSQSLQCVLIHQCTSLALVERVRNSHSCHSHVAVAAPVSLQHLKSLIMSGRQGQNGGMSTPVSRADSVGVPTKDFSHVEAWHSSTFPTHAFTVPILSNEILDWHFCHSAPVFRQGTRQENHQKEPNRSSCHVLQGIAFLCNA